MKALIGLAALTAAVISNVHAGETYKCMDGKKVSYSDEPCVNAVVVDTTPTRGMGTKKGADVQRIENREQLANAIKPLTGMDPQQFEQFGRRQKLPVQAQQDCKKLDVAMLEIQKNPSSHDAVKTYQVRKRFKDLSC